MLSIAGIIALLNDKSYKIPAEIIQRKQVYYGMSLHIDGACPMYYSLREPVLGWIRGNIVDKHPLMGWYGIEYHEIFDQILFNRYPTEPLTQRMWRFSQYKPWTRSYFGQAISVTTGAIFQDSGYSIIVEDNDDNDYIWGNNIDGQTLPGYFEHKFKYIAEDPNGYFVVIPKQPKFATTTQRIEPDIWFVCSKHLHYVSPDEIIFYRDGYKWVVNKFGYFRFEKREGTEDYYHVDEAEGGYYGHMLNKLPVFVAGGVWNSQGFYDSWLGDAKPLADEFVIIKSDQQVTAKNASHPFIIEVPEDCPDCQGGHITKDCRFCEGTPADPSDCRYCDGGTGGIYTACGTCHGKGYIAHNPGDRLVAPKEDMKTPLIQVVNIPVDANKMHSDNVKECELSILKALHLTYIEQAQSGVAKDRDMETRYQFILRVSNDMFDRLIEGALQLILSLRNVAVIDGTVRPSATAYTIVKPTQFQIKTSMDLLEEMKAAKDSGIPSYQQAALIEDYTDKQFGGNAVLKRKTWLINQMDKLANRSPAELSVMLLNNGASNRDYQFSIELPSILDALVRERGSEWFISSDYEKIKLEVDARFIAIKPIMPDIRVDERINV